MRLVAKLADAGRGRVQGRSSQEARGKNTAKGGCSAAFMSELKLRPPKKTCALDTYKSVEWRVPTLIVFNRLRFVPFVLECRVSCMCFAVCVTKKKQRKLGASRQGKGTAFRANRKAPDRGSRERHRERKALHAVPMSWLKAMTYKAEPSAGPCGTFFVVRRHVCKDRCSTSGTPLSGCSSRGVGNPVRVFGRYSGTGSGQIRSFVFALGRVPTESDSGRENRLLRLGHQRSVGANQSPEYEAN
jgi:hypothetical protein